MEERYVPELGQYAFGQPWQEFPCSDLMEAAIREIGREWERVTWNIYQESLPSPLGNTGAKWKCNEFEMEAYSWADCEECGDKEEDEQCDPSKCTCQQYNFKWQDIEVSWYKYIGRGMSQNRKTTPQEISDMLDACLEALKMWEKVKRFEKENKGDEVH